MGENWLKMSGKAKFCVIVCTYLFFIRYLCSVKFKKTTVYLILFINYFNY